MIKYKPTVLTKGTVLYRLKYAATLIISKNKRKTFPGKNRQICHKETLSVFYWTCFNKISIII